MKLPLRTAEAAEQKALRTAPPAPPEPTGLARYRAQLASDRRYRAALAAALALCLFAGAEFGRGADAMGQLDAGLWAATTAILITRLLDVQPGASPTKGQSRAQARTTVLAAIAAALLVSLLGLARIPGSDGPPWSIIIPLAFGATVACAAAMGAWRWVRRAAIYSLAVAWLAAGALSGAPAGPAVGCAAVLIVLELLMSRRPTLANALATAAFLHLGGLVLSGGGVLPSAVHLATAWVEISLLVYAGLRDLDASQWKPPRATYRAAPLSVVARLDRAQDHPVRIDVA